MSARKAHFIGIAGKGMSATALLLRESGWQISGSDENCYAPVSDFLAQAAIPFWRGYKKENIPADADIIVIGKNARLVPESNEEVAAAFASGKPVRSFPDMLHELTLHTDTIVVAGSYGKSTCAALLAWCLLEAKKDPSYFIGEVTKGLPAHAHLGNGGTFVLEGDEYPSANWDSSPKFLHYNPRNVLLTSATHDHINIYPTHEDYLKTFHSLLAALPHDGLLVINGGEPNARTLGEAHAGKKALHGTPEGWHAANVKYGMPTVFDLMRGKERVASLSTTLLGAHNVENIVGVSAMLLEKGLLKPEELTRGVESFKGVKRRMERLTELSRVPVLEGYGSSYEKTRSAIEAMRLHYPDRRLVVIFEPNTIGWRSRVSLPQYDHAFVGAAKVYVFNPPHDGKERQLSLEEIVERVRTSGVPADGIEEPSQALKLLEDELGESDCVLLSSSGAMGGLIESVPKLAERKFPI